MLHMTMKASALTTDLGQFTALVSTTDIDREGDVVLPSAFRGTIERWQGSAKMVPLHWDHGTQPEDIVGHVDPGQMEVQSNGLVVGGIVDLDSDRGQQVWKLLKSNRLGFSFGFVMNDSHMRSDGVREIRSVDLYEITATFRPSNDRTRVLSTKAYDDLGLVPDLGGFGYGARQYLLPETGEVVDYRRMVAECKAIGLRYKRSQPVSVASFRC
jgi:HK97 family phage prohead protease